MSPFTTLETLQLSFRVGLAPEGASSSSPCPPLGVPRLGEGLRGKCASSLNAGAAGCFTWLPVCSCSWWAWSYSSAQPATSFTEVGFLSLSLTARSVGRDCKNCSSNTFCFNSLPEDRDQWLSWSSWRFNNILYDSPRLRWVLWKWRWRSRRS